MLWFPCNLEHSCKIVVSNIVTAVCDSYSSDVSDLKQPEVPELTLSHTPPIYGYDFVNPMHGLDNKNVQSVLDN
jgi:hypothetical protein